MEAATSQAITKLSATQYTLLRYFEQYYWTHGRFPLFDSTRNHPKEAQERELAGLSGLSKDDWDSVTKSSVFVNSIISRKLPADDSALLLTEEQITVANVMLDLHDKRSKLKKLTELGISTSQYNAWLRSPAYRAYCLSRAEDLLEQSQPQAHLSLIGNVERGDLGSIKYFNELTGRYRSTSNGHTPSVEVNVSTTNQYGQDVLVQVVEIIQRHVKDPAILDAIAGDILELTKGTSQVVKGIGA